MIPRYARKEMTRIWSDETRYDYWLKVEILATEAQSKLGLVPPEAVEAIRRKARYDIARIQEIEAQTKHDVIAFVSAVAENIGPEGRYLHLGMTSSDVLDTALACQIRDAGILLLQDIEDLMEAIKRRAYEHKDTVMIGRSHGIHAEPTTFGLMLATFYEEFRRHRQRLYWALQRVAVGKMSGAVGTFANIDPSVEWHVCKSLGLAPDPVSTQIVNRDRHAEFFTVMALIASSIERLATEIRHLQRTEVYEAEEYFSPGQKGSSAMPHKRNPVLTENLTGLARLVRSMAFPALENVALWHERDISHSSVERNIGPDATVTLDFALARLTSVIEKLLVYPENMRKNLERLGGLHNSQRVLLKLVESGFSREKAYEIVQRAAMKIWTGGAKDFRTELLNEPAIRETLGEKGIDGCLDIAYHLKHVGTIFRRVFERDRLQ
ncbi:MAG: adenylosuccinate lyase [Deltaproteobacteria bacterium]|nr:adenylosuccinate lyase [Deltaproteobacteria bacterium]